MSEISLDAGARVSILGSSLSRSRSKSQH